MSKTRVFGVIPGRNDVRNYQAVCAASEEDFPDSFEITDLAEGWDQDWYGACTCFAMCTIMETHSRRQGDYSGRLSPWFLYGYRSNSYSGVGRHNDVVMKDARKLGTVPYDKFPHAMEAPQIIDKVNQELVDLVPDAYPFRITSTYELHTNAAIKAELLRGNPIYMVVEWYDDIEVGEDGMIHTNQVPSNSYHAVVMYGWDERGWKFQNSWGKDWGIGGRAVWSYRVPLYDVRGVSDEYSENMRKQKELEYIAKIEQLTAALEAKQNEVDRLSARYDASLVKYEESLLAIGDQKEKVAALESKIAENEAALFDTNKECEFLTDLIKQLRIELAEQKESTGESIEALQNMIALKQSALAALESDREQRDKVIRELKEELSQQTALKEEMERLQEAHEKLKIELAERVAELNSTRADLEWEKVARENLETQLIEIKKPYSSGIGKIIAKVLNFILNLFNKDK